MRYGDYLRKITGLILLGFLLSLGFLQPVQQFLSIPHQVTVFNHQTSKIKSQIPGKTEVSLKNQEIASAFTSGHSLQIKGKNTGETEMVFTAGNFPVKKVDVNVLPDIKLIPGGQSIGVKLNSVGVLVVGFHLVETREGEKSPGEKAGVKVGDIITKINDEEIQSMSDVKQFVRESGESGDPLELTIKREKNKLQKKLIPVKDKESNKYRIGLYIRDSAAGIGTMTFYDPKTGKYGALGHVISDMDTREPIVVHDGTITRSKVTAIDKGENGQPGEKIATISPERHPLGSITKNTPFGIFGKLNQSIRNEVITKPLPIALPKQVKEGPAKILTVVHGNKVETFDVKVVNSIPQKFPATKGLVIKITDPELLKKTGGIVQGMSGSPIIQDGKIIGAVTHVFVNDPTSGYGCHIEWMLKEAGIDIYRDQNDQKKAS